MQLSISILGAMDLSVLIPTYRRPLAIEQCLRALSTQRVEAAFEIIVGVDGDHSTTPDPIIPDSIRDRTSLVRDGRVGLVRLRQAMLTRARGRIVLWLNDDAYAESGLLHAHMYAHQLSGQPRVVAGRALWKPIQHANLFDRLVQTSDLVFFTQPEQRCTIDYRNCYGLNMSFPRELAGELGGVAQVQEHYGYEDIELAWRMSQAGASCVYEPNAIVTHDHRYTPQDVHRREYLLGRAAYAFAHANPEFATELFRVDLREQSVLESFEIAIRLAWRDALRIESTFLALDQHAPQSVSDDMLHLLAEHWVLLKRLLWRWGVLDASRKIDSRWSQLAETSPDQVLRAVPITV